MGSCQNANQRQCAIFGVAASLKRNQQEKSFAGNSQFHFGLQEMDIFMFGTLCCDKCTTAEGNQDPSYQDLCAPCPALLNSLVSFSKTLHVYSITMIQLSELQEVQSEDKAEESYHAFRSRRFEGVPCCTEISMLHPTSGHLAEVSKHR